MKIKIVWSVLLIICNLCAFANQSPQERSQTQQQLIQLQSKIKNIEKNITQDRQQVKKLQSFLQTLDIEIGQTNEQIRQLDKDIATNDANLKALYQQYQHDATYKKQHEKQLANILQQAYKNTQNERWQILLTETNITSKMRFGRYFEQLSQAQSHQIQRLIDHLSELQQSANKLETLKQKSQQLMQQQVHKRNSLAEAQTERDRLLKSLNAELQRNQSALGKLKSQEDRLNGLLSNLKSGLAKLPDYIEPVLRIDKAKKQLYFPIQGAYATLLAVSQHSKLKDKKTYIKSEVGTPVYAVYSGRVVFADWLRGIGLLLIIDHGNGYMSLYGNNDILYRAVGDWVNKADMIARVGQSGGLSEPGLYFELRKDGIALEASDWFQHS